ncbi:hypothetical protein Pmani_011797 [Petrolisthes manimaculis]|uniref:Uncharacterized protein n=1 Tax=Petrolisthes manimaculis TaxID=1843537 RepID=A0AAE1UFS4_9EUCA|nr:hypothetical protein Pmani_011797 [Petrolisthes manimaculis]
MALTQRKKNWTKKSVAQAGELDLVEFDGSEWRRGWGIIMWMGWQEWWRDLINEGKTNLLQLPPSPPALGNSSQTP